MAVRYTNNYCIYALAMYPLLLQKLPDVCSHCKQEGHIFTNPVSIAVAMKTA